MEYYVIAHFHSIGYRLLLFDLVDFSLKLTYLLDSVITIKLMVLGNNLIIYFSNIRRFSINGQEKNSLSLFYMVTK